MSNLFVTVQGHTRINPSIKLNKEFKLNKGNVYLDKLTLFLSDHGGERRISCVTFCVRRLSLHAQQLAHAIIMTFKFHGFNLVLYAI